MATTSRPMKAWTIAFRMSKHANHFKRVTNWVGTWHESRLMAAEFEAHNPGAEVWYVSTSQYEAYCREMIESGQWEDNGASTEWGNILVTDTKRIKMRDTGSVTDDMAESVRVQAWEQDNREAMNRAVTQDAIDTDTRKNGGAVRLVMVADEMNNVDRHADIRGDQTRESRKWRIVGAVKYVSPSDVRKYYVVKWWGDANRPDTVRIVHHTTLTNLY